MWGMLPEAEWACDVGDFGLVGESSSLLLYLKAFLTLSENWLIIFPLKVEPAFYSLCDRLKRDI
jgi:hypothetical protein